MAPLSMSKAGISSPFQIFVLVCIITFEAMLIYEVVATWKRIKKNLK